MRPNTVPTLHVSPREALVSDVDPLTEALDRIRLEQEKRYAVEVARIERLDTAGLTVEQISIVYELIREIIAERDEQFKLAVEKRDSQWDRMVRRYFSSQTEES